MLLLRERERERERATTLHTAHRLNGAMIPVLTRLVTASNAPRIGAATPEAKLQICWNELLRLVLLYQYQVTCSQNKQANRLLGIMLKWLVKLESTCTSLSHLLTTVLERCYYACNDDACNCELLC
jgi:hypothetical protein